MAMLGLGLLVLGAVLAPHLARLGVYTVPSSWPWRWVPSQVISAVVMSGYALMIAVTSTIAIGSAFDVVLGLATAPSRSSWPVGIVAVYSVAGGMWSITLTDIIQLLIKMVDR